MKTAVQSEALAAIFNGQCDAIMTNAVLSSKISVTPRILEQYDQKLGSNLQFQTWFASACNGRLSLNLSSLAPNGVKAIDAVTDGYGTAAYFGGSNLVAHLPDLSEAAALGFENIGIRVISVTKRIDFLIEGDNPVLTIGTESSGMLDFDVLDRFLIPEESVVIYDKFINNTSIQLLEHIARKLRAGASMRVFHTLQPGGKDLLSTTDISTRLSAANGAISVECKQCSQQFKKLEHDRYVFLGNRLQIVFSAGLDCFGIVNTATGRRTNRRSKISFYDVTGGDDLRIEGNDNSIYVVKQIASM